MVVVLMFLLFLGLNQSLQAYRFDNPYMPNLVSEKRKLNWYGNVHLDSYWDSRQVGGARDVLAQVIPLPKSLDAEGRDINARGRLNAVTITSLIGLQASGYDVLGAKASGVIDFDFFSNIEQGLGMPRQRQTYLALDWKKTNLLLGYTVHPMYIPGQTAATSQFLSTPFENFSLNPQVRVTHQLKHFSVMLALVHEQAFLTSVLDASGAGNAIGLQRSQLPIICVQAVKPFANGKHKIGVGLNVKSITPRIQTAGGLKTDERVTGISAYAFGWFMQGLWNIRTKFIYHENESGNLLPSGFGVRSEDANGRRKYTTLNAVSMWGEVEWGDVYQPAVFVGYAQSLGTSKKLHNYGTNAAPKYQIFSAYPARFDYAVSIAPRFTWNVYPISLAMELNWTFVRYADGVQDATGTTGLTPHGKPVNTTSSVNNFRIMGSAYYYF